MLLFEGKRLILGLDDTRGPYMNGRVDLFGVAGYVIFLEE